MSISDFSANISFSYRRSPRRTDTWWVCRVCRSRAGVIHCHSWSPWSSVEGFYASSQYEIGRLYYRLPGQKALGGCYGPDFHNMDGRYIMIGTRADRHAPEQHCYAAGSVSEHNYGRQKESCHDLDLVSPPGSGEWFSRGRTRCFWGAQPQTAVTDAPDACNLGKSRHVSRAPHPRAPGTCKPARHRHGHGSEFSVRHCVV